LHIQPVICCFAVVCGSEVLPICHCLVYLPVCYYVAVQPVCTSSSRNGTLRSPNLTSCWPPKGIASLSHCMVNSNFWCAFIEIYYYWYCCVVTAICNQLWKCFITQLCRGYFVVYCIAVSAKHLAFFSGVKFWIE